MATIKGFENRVSAIEGFNIRITQNGSNVRGDKTIPNTYPKGKASRNNWTVAEWKRNKFNPLLAGFDVEILNGDSDSVNGNTTLKTVRQSYEKDE